MAKVALLGKMTISLAAFNLFLQKCLDVTNVPYKSTCPNCKADGTRFNPFYSADGRNGASQIHF